MSTSQIRQNYHAECEAGINKQINIELHASYVYQSMVCFRFNINIGKEFKIGGVCKLRSAKMRGGKLRGRVRGLL